MYSSILDSPIIKNESVVVQKPATCSASIDAAFDTTKRKRFFKGKRIVTEEPKTVNPFEVIRNLEKKVEAYKAALIANNIPVPDIDITSGPPSDAKKNSKRKHDELDPCDDQPCDPPKPSPDQERRPLKKQRTTNPDGLDNLFDDNVIRLPAAESKGEGQYTKSQPGGEKLSPEQAQPDEYSPDQPLLGLPPKAAKPASDTQESAVSPGVLDFLSSLNGRAIKQPVQKLKWTPEMRSRCLSKDELLGLLPGRELDFPYPSLGSNQKVHNVTPGSQSGCAYPSLAVKRETEDDAEDERPHKRLLQKQANQKESLATTYFHRKIAQGMGIPQAAVCAGMAVSKATELARAKAASDKAQARRKPKVPESTPSSVRAEDDPEMCSEDVPDPALRDSTLSKSISPSNPHMNVDHSDDSGYFSESRSPSPEEDDGMGEDIARTLDEIEKEKAIKEEKAIEKKKAFEKEKATSPWRPLSPSPLQAEVGAEEASPPRMLKSKRRKPNAPTVEEERKGNKEVSDINDMYRRNYDRVTQQWNFRACRATYHFKRTPACKCRITRTACGILRLTDAILTPERVRRATHKQLKIIAHASNRYAQYKYCAIGAVNWAYSTLEKLPYGDMKTFNPKRDRGLSDLDVHAEAISRRYEEKNRKYAAKRDKARKAADEEAQETLDRARKARDVEIQQERDQRRKDEETRARRGQLIFRTNTPLPDPDWPCDACDDRGLEQEDWGSPWRDHLIKSGMHYFHDPKRVKYAGDSIDRPHYDLRRAT